MSTRLSQGCFLVLLSAMITAAAAGLLACGPIVLAVPAAGRLAHRGLSLAASLVLGLGCLGGAAALRFGSWPSVVRRPWYGFFASGLLLAGGIGVDMQSAALILNPLLAAIALFTMLGVLTERSDPRFGGIAVMAATSAAVVVTTGWTLLAGHGDQRPLLLLQSIPLMALVAGAPALHGKFTSTADTRWILVANAAAMVSAAVGGLAHRAEAFHLSLALAQSALTAGALTVAYRAAASSGKGGIARVDASRRTSLKISG
jgi:hypothetical protein